jgi:hypothetical protein
MADYVSATTAHRLEREADQAEGKLARIREGAKEMERKAARLGSAALVGFAYGALNTRQGGTATTPYSVGGKVPLDSALALGLGLVALFDAKEGKTSSAAIEGAASGAIAIYTSRYGAQWETTQQSAAGTATTPATTTTSGPMGRRPAFPGYYGAGFGAHGAHAARRAAAGY